MGQCKELEQDMNHLRMSCTLMMKTSDYLAQDSLATQKQDGCTSSFLNNRADPLHLK